MPLLTPYQPGYGVVRACKGLPTPQATQDPGERDGMCRRCRNCAPLNSPATAQPMERRAYLAGGCVLACPDFVPVLHGASLFRLAPQGHPYGVGGGFTTGHIGHG